MKINKSKAPAKGWVKKALCAGVIMGMSMTAGTSFADLNDNDGNNAITPFARVAQLPVVRVNGQIDLEATYNKAKAVALVIARYFANKNDVAESGFPANWILGGLELAPDETATDAEVNGAIIRIPSPELIDPSNPDLGIKKANVMDLCNSHYAKQALGVSPITGIKGADSAKYVVNGYSHTPALPCELSTWNDDKHIYVDILDPNGIFGLFFTDVFASEEMGFDDFKAAITALPPAVKNEIMSVVYKALDEANDGAGLDYEAMDKAIGPEYPDLEAAFEVVANSPNVSPFKHVAYTKSKGELFGAGETKAVAEAIIEAMTIHGEPDAGDQVNQLERILSPDSKWRSARHDPLGLPGTPEKNWVIEACSPTYAKMAMSTGMHHVTALPCEISVQRVNVDESEDGSTEALVISYLDPNFMLGALFADMSDEEKEALGGIPALILGDLETIVQYALDKSHTKLDSGEQIWYDMLPY
jgi:hypothetical protein